MGENKVCAVLGLDELRDVLFWRDCLCEMFCAGMMLMPLIFNYISYDPDFIINPTHVGLVMGFTVCVLIETFGHMSGAHMNPIISLCLALRRDIKPVRAIFYTICHLLGAAVFSAIILGLTPPNQRYHFKAFTPAVELGPIRAMFTEAVLSFTHTMVSQGVSDPYRPTPCNMPGVIVGFSIALHVMIGMTWTGASFNPCIAFGPAVITGDFKYYWVYFAGDYIGALISAAVYNFLMFEQRRRFNKKLKKEIEYKPEHGEINKTFESTNGFGNDKTTDGSYAVKRNFDPDANSHSERL